MCESRSCVRAEPPSPLPAAVLYFLLQVSFLVDEGVSPVLLQLLSCALCGSKVLAALAASAGPSSASSSSAPGATGSGQATTQSKSSTKKSKKEEKEKEKEGKGHLLVSVTRVMCSDLSESTWFILFFFFFFFINFYWSVVALQRCVSFLLYCKVNQSYVYTYPLFFRFPSHLVHHRALSRVPCAIQ